MTHKRPSTTLLLLALFLGPSAVASTTWYVNGVSGSNSNTCTSPTTACKTIKRAISLAAAGDSILVAAATYKENLSIGFSLRVIGSGASTTIIDGGQTGTVVAISSSSALVTLSKLTIRDGFIASGGGTTNSSGGGISNRGTLTIDNSTITGNGAHGGNSVGFGGGIANWGRVTVNNSTLTGNFANGIFGAGIGGGIANAGTATVNNSTLSGNSAVGAGGGILNRGSGNLKINNSTISGNKAPGGGGIANLGTATVQNSIVANNSGGNCLDSVTSKGYNLSSDGSCNFNGPGDVNNTNPMLGPLQYNGGPTKTMALPSGSPAIDAGNPSGCTDGHGHLLKADQRGKPRPDAEDTGGCDMGAFERQSD